MYKSKSGFTIVELLIVIVVIGILAAISIVAYTGIQNRAHDTKVRSIATQVAKAFQLWNAQSSVRMGTGGSASTGFTDGVCYGGSGGWLAKEITSYTCTMETSLVHAKLIPPDLLKSAPNTNKLYSGVAYTFMFYPCGTDRYALLYALHSADTKEIATLRSTCAGGAAYGPVDSYGMNGGMLVSIGS